MFGTISCNTFSYKKTGLEGKPLPKFDLLLTDSLSWVHSGDIQKGNPVALFYFSPSCPYCKAQIKDIIADIDDLNNIDFYFITKAPFKYVKTFNSQYKLDRYHNIKLGVDTGYKITKYFKMPGVPYWAIYNKDKKLNKAFPGKILCSQIKAISEE